jgi:hypothetical protein
MVIRLEIEEIVTEPGELEVVDRAMSAEGFRI